MHPEAGAFLDAIFDSPDDDTARLVYADWLQEHDQNDFAQFVRLSVRAVSGSLLPAERKRLESERKGIWKRIRAVRYDAIVGVRIQDYERGILNRLTTYGDSLTRTIDQWWPAMTPRSLAVDGAHGFSVRSIESELVTAVIDHVPWLRELTLMSTHRAEPNVDDPFEGTLFAALAKPGVLPRLRSLHVEVARLDAPALRAFAASDLAARLETFSAGVGATDGDFDERIAASGSREPNAVRLAIEAFLARHG